MYFYDVFIDGEYHLTLKANCQRDAEDEANAKYGCYGILSVRRMDEERFMWSHQVWFGLWS